MRAPHSPGDELANRPPEEWELQRVGAFELDPRDLEAVGLAALIEETYAADLRNFARAVETCLFYDSRPHPRLPPLYSARVAEYLAEQRRRLAERPVPDWLRRMASGKED